MDGIAADLLITSIRLKNRVRKLHQPPFHPRTNEMYLLHLISQESSDEPMGISQLSRRLGVSQPTATQAVQLLVEKGYVERTAAPGDRRAVHLRLTQAGLEAQRAQQAKTLEAVQDYIAFLGPEDAVHLQRIAHRTLEYFSHCGNKMGKGDS